MSVIQLLGVLESPRVKFARTHRRPYTGNFTDGWCVIIFKGIDLLFVFPTVSRFSFSLCIVKISRAENIGPLPRSLIFYSVTNYRNRILLIRKYGLLIYCPVQLLRTFFLSLYHLPMLEKISFRLRT